MKSPVRRSIAVKGIVQGVGFRPFVYRLAQNHKLRGWVLNSSSGVTVEVEGPIRRVDAFVKSISTKGPANARIDSVRISKLPFKGYHHFTIQESVADKGSTLLSPDLATCSECREDITAPGNRRKGYPFTNCTNCGPRYSIIKTAPYDRVNTTMRSFKMCRNCAAEYQDVLDRRFHAQPNACPVCGPKLALYRINRRLVAAQSPIEKAVHLLLQGKILAVKGLGGFHIACDATNEAAVIRLRRRKGRPHKPLALMCRLSDVPLVARLTRPEALCLASPQAPILLLPKRKTRILAPSIAPANPYLGIMLPCTPVHHLLLGKLKFLVMTSGNRQDEPIVIDDKECFSELGGIVDYVLTNDRPIENRNDDSIVTYAPSTAFSILRRSRGYAPDPIDLPVKLAPTLGCGGELKSTFCIARNRTAFLSPHVGDMENGDTMSAYQQALAKYHRWFRFEPQVVAYDLHPDYMTTRFAKSTGIARKVGVQHHFAHIASCLAENLVSDRVIGLAFDGTGYGTDGKIWGCEFLVGDLTGFDRVAHLAYLPLPGGETSIRHPFRIGLAYLIHILKRVPDLPFVKEISRRERRVIERMLGNDFNLVDTSSLGRLFDAIAAILGVTRQITFEAQAAMQLEYLATDRTVMSYPAEIRLQNNSLVIDPAEIISGVVTDVKHRLRAETIAVKFHNSVIAFSINTCKKLRQEYNISKVALSGGAFQNRLLLEGLVRALKKNGFAPIFHQKVPYNDGGIALGQVILANRG